METNVLVCGGSFAGLATAYWMNRLGYTVTLVEIADGLKRGGSPVNIEGPTIEVVEQMGLLNQIRANTITMTGMEFRNSDDLTVGSNSPHKEDDQPANAGYELERDGLLTMMFDAVKDDVAFKFGDTVASMTQDGGGVDVSFRGGETRRFGLVFGCDGIHSLVRKLCFGEEAKFASFLKVYFSISIVDRLLIPEFTTQMYNEPDRLVMLNAYNGKTDIILCFHSDDEIQYDYRNEGEQRTIITDRFASVGWRTPKLLQDVVTSKTFYFDKLCHMRMPSWSQGRVALVGDAAYCPSPAAGRGGSAALDGAAALAESFKKHGASFQLAFDDYERTFRPFIEKIQAEVIESSLAMLVPRTEEAIRKRNAGGGFL